MGRHRSRGFGASVAGAVTGELTGFLLAAVVSSGAYYPFGGASCAGIEDACDEPFGRAILLFLVLACAGLLAGATIGCHLALRSTGLPGRRLTVILVPVLTVAAMALLIAGATALSSSLPAWILLVLVLSLLVLAPLAARLLATRGHDLDGSDPGPVGDLGPPRRAWGPDRPPP